MVDHTLLKFNDYSFDQIVDMKRNLVSSIISSDTVYVALPPIPVNTYY